MADKAHLKILKQGVQAWNQWRIANPQIEPDLRGIHLSREKVIDRDLNGIDFSNANLSGAHIHIVNLSGANLSGANLSGAVLQHIVLRHADLRTANLSRADLRRADLEEATLTGATLTGATLAGAKLSRADLKEAILSGANLSGAIFHLADLTDAICEQANFSNTDPRLARLFYTKLDGSTLTGVRLWETQRAWWSIKGIICESSYWDERGRELTSYTPHEFERLYAEKVRVLVRYPDGISPLEIVTLPALIQHLAASRPGCRLRFESIQDGPGGAVVTIVVEGAEYTPPAQTEQLIASIQAEAEQKVTHLRKALESERESVLILGIEVRKLEWIVDKLLSRPTFQLQRGDAIVGDEYNVGQAGAVGPKAHAHDMTFNQIGGNVERAMDLSTLAGELATLRQAMKDEATEPEHDAAVGEVAKAEQAAKAKDSTKVVESLKGAGTWALDVATKIGTTLASEALKDSLGMK